MTDTPIDPRDEDPKPPATSAAGHRLFLVVVDNTTEWRAALRFACRRAFHTDGRVALLHVIEPAEFEHWMAIGDMIRNEQREEGERLLQRIAKEVNMLTGTMPAIHLREGSQREELLKLIAEEPAISILVLAANQSGEGPGPLVQYLTGKGINRLSIPVTIVPGDLADDRIDDLA